MNGRGRGLRVTGTAFAQGAAVIIGLTLTMAPTAAAMRQTSSAAAGTATYTTAQAARGKTLYDENCASCHAPDLAGSPMAPPLGRGLFIGGRRPFRQLVDYAQLFMPLMSPGGMSRQQDRKSTRLNSSHVSESRMPSSA